MISNGLQDIVLLPFMNAQCSKNIEAMDAPVSDFRRQC
jgi:hypothetical protein